MQIALAFVTLCAAVPAASPSPIHFKEHSANIRRLGTEGSLAMGARFSDLGLLVVRAGSEAEAHALFDAAPR